MKDQRLDLQHSGHDDVPGCDITEEAFDKLEVECGFCGKLVRMRSLTAHVGAIHSDHFGQNLARGHFSESLK